LGESIVTDTEDKAKFRKIKPQPTAGLFGFAGATRVQPGQQDFDPKAGKLPFDPGEDKDKT
jgi:hypothetical protein